MLVIGASAPSLKAPERPASPLAEIIVGGEHEQLEFKETLRWDVMLGEQNKKLEDVVVKTLAGFANRSGGTLLIGVADNGTVPGLARDFACLGGNRDKLELHLTNLFGKHFGSAFRAARIRVSFPQHESVEVCRLDIERSTTPVFVSTADRNGALMERFFVRSGNSAQELTPRETAAYIGEHFRNRV